MSSGNLEQRAIGHTKSGLEISDKVWVLLFHQDGIATFCYTPFTNYNKNPGQNSLSHLPENSESKGKESGVTRDL